MGHRWHRYNYEAMGPKMTEHDQMMIDNCAMAERIVAMSQYQLGHLGGIIAESDPLLARSLMLAIQTTLIEREGENYVLATE
jgi:hypothetical protein